jgi:flagellar motility protein MotE (MotC chaperone)
VKNPYVKANPVKPSFAKAPEDQPASKKAQSNSGDDVKRRIQGMILKRQQRKASQRKSTPWVLGAGVLIAALAVAGYIVLPSTTTAWEGLGLGSIRIGWLSRATAASSEKSTDTSAKAAGKAVGEAAKGADPNPPAETPAAVSDTPPSAEELNHFSKLRERKMELDLREQELARLEEELQKQKLEIEGRLQRLTEVRDDISKLLSERVKVDQERVGKLVEFYSSMKPQQAATIMEKIDEDLAVEILGQMKKKNAAEIINLLQADKARRLSEKFAGYAKK